VPQRVWRSHQALAKLLTKVAEASAPPPPVAEPPPVAMPPPTPDGPQLVGVHFLPSGQTVRQFSNTSACSTAYFCAV
jgi:hypothetical protein